MKYKRVEDSREAALGAGILWAILDPAYSHNPFVEKVEADPDQVGAEAEMFVYMRGNVILRLHVTEVTEVP